MPYAPGRNPASHPRTPRGKYRHTDPVARFWSRIAMGPNGCWVWTASTGSHGYGQLSVNQTMVTAHRYSHELNTGPIPKGMTVDHMCCNRRCVNPAHLQIVTNSENVRLAWVRRRGQ